MTDRQTDTQTDQNPDANDHSTSLIKGYGHGETIITTHNIPAQYRVNSTANTHLQICFATRIFIVGSFIW